MGDPRDDFANDLRIRVEDKKLTQRTIAESVGVSQQTVSGWLGGKTIPELDVLEALAPLVGGDLEWWMRLKLDAIRESSVKRRSGGLGPTSASTPADRAPAALSGKWDRLTPAQRATIEALVDELIGPEGDDG